MSDCHSYVQGSFQAGAGEPVPLLNPVTEEEVAKAWCGGVDLRAALEHARQKGLPSLRAMSFAERGEMLAKLAACIHEHRDTLIEASVLNGGTTRSGAKFDIDGAAGTLAAYADIAKELGDGQHLLDGEGVPLGRGARLLGRHAWFGRPGVSVFINAFNFPAWGFAEKAATALVAGTPVINKPGTATCLTSHVLAEILVDSGLLPEGAFTQILGPITPLLEALGPQDVVAFTGSSGTAAKIRGNAELIRRSVHVNVEADSLNAAVLAHADTDSGCYQLFLRDVTREIMEKSGQKCTATRRLIVAEELVERVSEDLVERLSRLKVGNPATSGVEVGPLATARQRDDVHAGMDRLAAVAERLCGENRPADLIDVPEGRGFFAGPSLFLAKSDEALEEVHKEEVFGPCATILPFSGDAGEASCMVARGGGMLVSSVYSDSRPFMKDVLYGIAPFCGRVVLIDSKAEGASLPTGMVMPQLLHGGPGRAGGGEELGGIRGVQHYLHRAAIQGPSGVVERLLKG